ncbi:MAG: glycosyltransferase [Actinomycetota bacterium]|nr:glycosyltransferase [Actinomycetota bacterium]
MRILLVSSMYPGAADPDFGTFVKGMADEIERQGHDVARAVVDRRAGSVGKQLALAGRALSRARAFRPDVVYAQYLFPAGGAAALAAAAVGRPLVVTALGRDVRNVGDVPGFRAATRVVLARADAVIATSQFIRRGLVERFPRVPVDVVSDGIDLERFRGRDAEEARRRVGWEGEPPRFLCVGALDERKNVRRLADAFRRLGGGSLAFVGEGPERAALAGRPRVHLVGRVPNAVVADWIAASDVICQPSLVEPFGHAILEAMASERSVVATAVGGPPEFVAPEAGVLVDPTSVEAIEEGMRAAAELPSPNLAAREAAAVYDVRGEATRVIEILERVRVSR